MKTGKLGVIFCFFLFFIKESVNVREGGKKEGCCGVRVGWGLQIKWVEAGRMLNELSGSLSSCILLGVFSTLPVQKGLAKDFLDKAWKDLNQANQLFLSLCAHAPGGKQSFFFFFSCQF